MQFRAVCLVLFSFVITTARSFGQKYLFDNYTVRDGLSQSQVTDICQDQYNNMWLATLGGICKFDGKTFTTYTQADGLISNFAASILVDKNNNIWIGTIEGISVFDGTHFINHPSRSFIEQLTEDKQGRIWGIQDFKIVSVGKEKIQQINIIDGNEKITYLSKNADGDICAFVYGKGVYYFKENRWGLLVALPDKYKHSSLQKIYFNKKDSTIQYLVSFDSVFLMKNGNITFVSSFRPSALRNIAEDDQGNIWLGTNDGAVEISSGVIIHYNEENGFCNSKVMQVYADREGFLWLCTDGKGVFKYHGGQFQFFDQLGSHKDPFVTSIACANDRRIYMGTRGDGLYISENGKVSQVLIDKNNPYLQRINCMYPTAKAIWIGTDNGGVLKITNEKVTIENRPSRQLPHVVSIFADENQTIWVGTTSGLYCFKESKIGNILLLKDKLVSSITSFSKDSLLIGTDHGLFWLINEKDLRPCNLSYLNESSIAGLVHVEQYYFIATGNNGILVWNTKSNVIKSYSINEGLISDQVFCIYSDMHSKLWVGTAKGLQGATFSPSNGTLVFDNPDLFPFISRMEYNQNSISEDQDGRIWAGSTQGVFIFKNTFQRKPVHPNVVLESVQVLSKPIIDKKYYDSLSNWYHIPGKLILPYTQNDITFQFRGITMSDPRLIRYTYKLEGLENKFSSPTQSNSVIYSSLAPGNYIFKVKAITGFDEYSNELTFAFTIKSPFYSTPIFIISSILLSALVVYLVILFILQRRKKRSRMIEALREQEQQKVRQKTSEDFHDELGNKLTRITVLTDILDSKINSPTEEEKSIIEQIKENAASLYSGTKDIIWSLNPESDNLYEVLRHVGDFALELFENTTITFSLEGLDEKQKSIKLPMEYGRNILMIFKEALTNILKHSGCKAVSLTVESIANDRAVILLKDDGIGFDMTVVKKGNGIRNMSGRAARINSSIEINQDDTKGTIVKLDLRYP